MDNREREQRQRAEALAYVRGTRAPASEDSLVSGDAQAVLHIAATGSWHGEIWNRRKDGAVSPQWMTITAVQYEAGRPVPVAGISAGK